MRPSAMILVLLLTASAAPYPSRRQHELMNDIERAIRLPEGAKPLSKYDRNYAFAGPDKVVAKYLMLSEATRYNKECDAISKKSSSERCTTENANRFVKFDGSKVGSHTPAGKRRWFENAQSLPFIYDGGCMQVNVEYDIPTQRITEASCNGYG